MDLKARVIYNPSSGREIIKRDLVDILNIYEQAGYETSAFATTSEKNSASKEAKRISEKGIDLLIVAGGDGTINEVVNGIANLENRPKIAIIPTGTTNDYARALAIPRDNPIEAAKLIFNNHSVKVDVGKANNLFFINIAAGGSLSELTYKVPSRIKSMYGYLAYVIKGAEIMTHMDTMNLKIEYDNEVYEGITSMFFLTLTNSVGGFEQLAPDVRLDDGRFTLLIVKTNKIPNLVGLIAEALTNSKHINNTNIIYAKAKKIKIT